MGFQSVQTQEIWLYPLLIEVTCLKHHVLISLRVSREDVFVPKVLTGAEKEAVMEEWNLVSFGDLIDQMVVVGKEEYQRGVVAMDAKKQTRVSQGPSVALETEQTTVSHGPSVAEQYHHRPVEHQPEIWRTRRNHALLALLSLLLSR